MSNKVSQKLVTTRKTVNEHELTGHLGWAPELKVAASGKRWSRIGLVGDHSQRADITCFDAVAEQVAGLPAGTVVRVRVKEPFSERSWQAGDGEVRTGRQAIAASVSVLTEVEALAGQSSRADQTTTVFYVGNLCWDPDTHSGRGGMFVSFGLATDDGTRFEVVAFGPLVTVAARLAAGDRVSVGVGRPPEERTWREADGSEHHELRLVSASLERLQRLPPGVAQSRILQRVCDSETTEVLR